MQGYNICRLIAVKFPVRYPRICSRGRVYLVVSLVWVEAILFSVIPLLPSLGGYRYLNLIARKYFMALDFISKYLSTIF